MLRCLLAGIWLLLTNSAWAQSTQISKVKPGSKPVRAPLNVPKSVLAKITSAVSMPTTATGSGWYEMSLAPTLTAMVYTTYFVSPDGVVVANPRLGADPLRPAAAPGRGRSLPD